METEGEPLDRQADEDCGSGRAHGAETEKHLPLSLHRKSEHNLHRVLVLFIEHLNELVNVHYRGCAVKKISQEEGGVWSHDQRSRG